jgi:CBS domain containing-hemolysin-like protein
MGTETKIIKIILLCTFFILSSFAASSETALFSLSRYQIKQIQKQNPLAFEKIKILLLNPSRILILILLINEISNISISSIITQFIENNLGRFAFINTDILMDQNKRLLVITLLSMIISFPLILIVGEITPKIIAVRLNKLIAILIHQPLYLLFTLIKPILIVTDSIIFSLLKIFKIKGKDPFSKSTRTISEDDLVFLMEEGHREGTVNYDERKLIKKVLEFDDIPIEKVITPIEKVFAVNINANIYDILKDLKQQQYSRIPVYDGSKKNLVGVIHIKHIIKILKENKKSKIKVSDIMKPIYQIKSQTPLLTAFKKFKKNKVHIAACIDNDSKTLTKQAIGIVTMEDLLEKIFGDIKDERDITK